MGEYLKKNIREYGLLVALVVIMIFFQILTNGVLFRPVNITNLVLQNSFIVIMALGMLLIIVAGHIDLSVGSIVAFTGAMSAIMLVKWGLPAIVVVPLAILMGAIMGAAQGYWVAYQKIPSFIVTLAGMLVFRGMTYVVLSGRPVGPFPKEFQVLSTGFVPDFLSITDPSTSLIKNYVALVAVLLLVGYAVYAGLRERRLNAVNETENEPFGFFAVQMAIIGVVAIFIGFQLSTYRGLPNVLVIMGLLIALYAFITTRTTIGRRIYAMGGNEKAAKLSGINTERLTFYTFVNMGALAALAGMIIAARLNSATPRLAWASSSTLSRPASSAAPRRPVALARSPARSSALSSWAS